MRLNRRVPVGTHGGVRGRLYYLFRGASYSIHSLGSIAALRTGLSSRNSTYCRIRRYGAIISGESTHPAEPVVSIVRSQFTCAAEIGT